MIDQLTRVPAQTPGWSGRLLMFSATLLFISAGTYFGLLYGYMPYIDGQVGKLKDQMQSFSQQVSTDDQHKITTFYSQLTNVKSLLDTRTTPSALFSWLEKNTMPNVFYARFAFNATAKQLALGGSARSVDDIMDEVRLFQAQPEVERVNVGSIAAAASLWQFDLSIFFKSIPSDITGVPAAEVSSTSSR